MTQSVSSSLRETFAARYGCPPAVVARAPGRVNLIGEHTDYSLLPVLPIAIDRSLLVAAASTADGVVEANSERFPDAVRIDRGAAGARLGSWHRYVAGALRQLEDIAHGCGARVHVGGDLPHAGGLSSSSALTVGLMAALNACWEAGLDDEEIVRRSIVAERHAGVESGGMDQAVIVFARAGTAMRIDFELPSRRFVPLPEGLAFVVAASGEEAPKGGAARDAYNERVIGARLAAALLAVQIGLDVSPQPALRHVAGVDVVDILADELPEKASAQEVSRSVGLDANSLVRLTAGRFDHEAKVPVRHVARHVLTEAARVDHAEAALLAGELEAFGALLDESHDSLRQDFRCSTPALDRVCAAMRKAGAFGARLTGAGFGGFALAAVPPGRVAAVIGAAISATGGPSFEVRASDGLRLLV